MLVLCRRIDKDVGPKGVRGPEDLSPSGCLCKRSPDSLLGPLGRGSIPRWYVSVSRITCEDITRVVTKSLGLGIDIPRGLSRVFSV